MITAMFFFREYTTNAHEKVSNFYGAEDHVSMKHDLHGRHMNIFTYVYMQTMKSSL